MGRTGIAWCVLSASAALAGCVVDDGELTTAEGFSALAASYDVVQLGPADARSVVAIDLNDNNDVVGTLVPAAGGSEQPFFQSADGEITLLPIPEDPSVGDYGRATALSNTQIVAGNSATTAIRWDEEGVATLLPGMATLSPSAVNDAGLVVGEVAQGCGMGGCDERPALWTPAGVLVRPAAPAGYSFGVGQFDALNEAGVAVGTARLCDSTQSCSLHLVRWTIDPALFDDPAALAATSLEDLGTLGATELRVGGVDAAGTIVGALRTGTEPMRAFVRSPSGVVTVLDCAEGCALEAINSAGDAVGSRTSGGVLRAILYAEGKVQELDALRPVGSGLTLSNAVDINDAGVILARAFDGSVEKSVLLKPAPATEPPQTRWDYAADAEGWTLANGLLGGASGGYFGLSYSGQGPYMQSPDHLGIPAAEFPRVRLRFEGSLGGSVAELQFVTEADGSWDAAKKVEFAVRRDASMTEYVVDLSTVAGYAGTIRAIRFTPSTTGASGGLRLDFIRFEGEDGYDDGGAFQLLNRQNWMCAAAVEGSTKLIQTYCRDTPAQRFRLEWPGDGSYRVVNGAAGAVVDVSGASTAEGASLVLSAPGAAATQRWQLVSAGAGYSKLSSSATGKLASAPPSDWTGGASLRQLSDAGGQNQQWTLTRLP